VSEQPKTVSNTQTLTFMVVLCTTCAMILAVLATSLRERQEKAEELNRSQEMLIAAHVFSPEGVFYVLDDNGEYVSAKVQREGVLVPSQEKTYASSDEIFDIYQLRTNAFLVNSNGERLTFDEAGIDKGDYISQNMKSGYANLPLKLVYEVSPNGIPAGKMQEGKIDAEAYIIPVKGFGLWDAIYGYIAFKSDGDTVIGTAWYDHKETPGLGANIANPVWQGQFPGKALFLDGAGSKDVAPLGITVVRGKANEVFAGSLSKEKSAVDGMAGATLTGNGVTKAFKDSLGPYREFLMILNDSYLTKKQP
jgi:Na+-transporting NADH:ubiquinone oxidoreductase subunit C